MSKKSDLIKKLDKVCEDIMDHYDKYNDSEKQKVIEFYQSAIQLNESLEYYDDSKKKRFLQQLKDAFHNFFG